MTELLQAYKEQIEKEQLSDLEASWGLNVSVDDFKRILSGEKPLTEAQEIEIRRYVTKRQMKGHGN